MEANNLYYEPENSNISLKYDSYSLRAKSAVQKALLHGRSTCRIAVVNLDPNRLVSRINFLYSKELGVKIRYDEVKWGSLSLKVKFDKI